ncbi:MAG: DHH family phosphoesterase [Clostridia bacterium]|nr:DHH family phosphoesterase [Clostridia bacterium]
MATQRKWNKAVADMLSALKGAGSIALMAHVSPDGDTLGSVLALRLALKKLGKEVAVFCQHPVPQMLMFMEGAEEVLPPDRLAEKVFDLAVAVDVADIGRMGDCRAVFERAQANAQIDHHDTNPGYAQVNLVDSQACATGEIVYELIGKMGLDVDKEMAICLYTALSTDTGNFSFDNTTAKAFTIMSKLMACGLPLNRLNRILFRLRSREQAKLLARALSSLAFYEDDQISGMRLSLKDFEECEALPEHAEAIVNFAMDIIGVQMAFFCRETKSGGIKVSLRALPPSNVARVAARFGGGGHALAAGCTLHTTLDEAARLLVDAMKEEM